MAKVLPPAILEKMELKSLKNHNISFIDHKLRKQEADILYSVNFRGKPGFIYVLLEHASTPDPLLPVRMIRYMLAILEKYYDKKKSKKPQTFPYIYPLILYTGNRPFNVSLDFFELFGDEKDDARKTFFNPCSLVNLRETSDEDLLSYSLFSVAGLATKHVHDKDFLPAFKQMIPLIKILADRGLETQCAGFY